VGVVRAAFDEAHPAQRLDVDRTGFEEPTLEEAVRRDQRVAWVANGDDVASAGRNLVVGEVTLEGARLAALWPVEVEAEVSGRFDPGHDSRDVVEVEVAACPQAVHHLLEPRRTTLRIRRDDDVGRERDELEARGEARLGHQTGRLRLKLLDRRRTPWFSQPSSHRHRSIHDDRMPSRPRSRLPPVLAIVRARPDVPIGDTLEEAFSVPPGGRGESPVGRRSAPRPSVTGGQLRTASWSRVTSVPTEVTASKDALRFRLESGTPERAFG